MTANIALRAVTRNVMLEVGELSDKIRSPYLWSFEGSIFALAGLNVYFPVFMTPQESILSLPVLH
jgi:hypothetical protein